MSRTYGVYVTIVQQPRRASCLQRPERRRAIGSRATLARRLSAMRLRGERFPAFESIRQFGAFTNDSWPAGDLMENSTSYTMLLATTPKK